MFYGLQEYIEEERASEVGKPSGLWSFPFSFKHQNIAKIQVGTLQNMLVLLDVSITLSIMIILCFSEFNTFYFIRYSIAQVYLYICKYM